LRKIIIPLLLFLLSFSVYSFSQSYIREIKLSGNKNVSEEKIFSLIKTKIGSEFSEEGIRNDIKVISQTGYFKNVGYEYEQKEDGVYLKILLEENPSIREIYFSGNRVFKKKKLLEFLGINKGDVFNEVKLKEGIEQIRQNYIKKGVNLAEISYEIKQVDEKVDIHIKIDEKGGRNCIGEIVFKGNKSFSNKELSKCIKHKRRKMPIFRGTFKQDVLEKDIESIKKFYKKNGFLDVQIEGKIIPVRHSLIKIEFDIKEGEKYFLGDIDFQGNLIFDKNKLFSALTLKNKGEVFNEEKAQENIRNILDIYYNKGYIKASVTPIPTIQDKYINITYYIEPENVYHAEEIKVKGNTKTKDKVIRREVEIYPGDIITAKKIKESWENLRALNYFDEINIFPEFTEKESANVVVDVKERERTGIFMLGGGYSSVDNVVGVISIQQNNFDITNPPHFIGGGQRISLTTEIGTEAENFTLSFTEPYFLDKPIWFGPDIYRLTHEWDDYTIERTGGDLRIGRRWEKFSFGAKFLSEKNDLSDVDIPSIRYQEGDLTKNSINFSFVYNNFDSKSSPTIGDKLDLEVEYAGGILNGDIDFIKPTIENNYYHPLGRWTFHSRTYAGWLSEDIEDIPIYERFFGGGIGTVRGYDERTLSPKDAQGYYVGGKTLFAQNLEMIYPLYKDMLKGVLFFDIGNVSNKWDFSELKKGVGAGIKVIIPFFNAPIEVYYGYALDEEPGEDKGQLHIGMSFGF